MKSRRKKRYTPAEQVRAARSWRMMMRIAGLSGLDAAKACGCSFQFISRLINGIGRSDKFERRLLAEIHRRIRAQRDQYSDTVEFARAKQEATAA